MTGSTGIGGRCGGSIALLLFCLLLIQPAALAGERDRDDEPVGWPLSDNDRELQPRPPATPLPQRSEVTDDALAAWPGNELATTAGVTTSTSTVTSTVIQGGAPAANIAGGSAAAPEIISPEIAPLKRIIPPLRHERIIYAPGDFSISVATAERLDQLAMRLRGTRDRISIVAHSGTGTGDAQFSTHEAVKLSFKRAMLVRLYLIEEGVSPDQIDLEALPQADDDGPADRVEISPTSKAARR